MNLRLLAENLRRQLKRPLVALLVIAGGMMIFLPKVVPHEVELRYRLPRCGEKISAAAYAGAERARSATHWIRGRSELTHTFLLPRGDYRIAFELECPGGDPVRVERSVSNEENVAVSLDFSDECAC
jgi:hypothetical protein